MNNQINKKTIFFAAVLIVFINSLIAGQSINDVSKSVPDSLSRKAVI